ncbi:hypothetical protein A3715_10830 [Oleiphilus sp. HI0009]|nr:hypothetical protein A3715_10830 [Oleiphilus sp. HI0009]
MANSFNVNDNANSRESANSSAVSEKLFNAYSQHVSPLLDQSFDAIDDTLFDLANNARNNNEQNRYFEAMRELRLKRKAICTNIDQSLQSLFQFPFEQIKLNTPAPSQVESLSVVDDKQFEEQLAVETMASKSRANFQHIHLTLHQRMAEAYQLNGDELSPESPELLAHIIASSCKNLDIELGELLLLYKHLDKHLFSKLEEPLNALNDTLISEGIQPDLSLTKRKQSLRSKQETTRAPVAHDHRDITAQENTTQTATQTIKTQHYASSQDIIQALNIVNAAKEATNEARFFDAKTISQYVTQQLQKSSRKQVAEKDLDVINLVGLLFEYILNDNNLAPEMQALIGRLQIPVLKAVIHNPVFFKEHAHPARTFINNLATAAIGWTNDNQNSARTKLYDELRSLVDDIIEDKSGHYDCFTASNLKLELFIARENKRQKLLEQRTKLTEEGRIKSRVAQEFIDSTLKALVESHRNLPTSISELLTGPWRRVLFIAFLRDAQEHNWDTCRKTTEDLLWCTRKHATQNDRQKWLALVPRLLKQIDAELTRISFDPYSANRMLADIKKDLTSIFRETALSNQNDASLNKPNNASSTGAITKQKSLRPQLNKNVELLAQLEIGRWVQIKINGNLKRYKLISRVDEANVYVFADRFGLNPIELSSQQVVAQINKGMMVILEKGALVDRALNHILSNLQS